MMSDEETVGDTYVRHRPSYRSERLNRFIDSHLQTTPSRHARHTRVLGSPVEKNAPARARSWMVKGTDIAADNEQNVDAPDPVSDEDIFGESEQMND